jgi:Flp pilus assembly pilin Flp
MPYRLLGHLHATAYSLTRALRREQGQGTVEYVALILLLALVFAAVVQWGTGKHSDIGSLIVNKLKGAINDVGSASAGSK